MEKSRSALLSSLPITLTDIDLIEGTRKKKVEKIHIGGISALTYLILVVLPNTSCTQLVFWSYTERDSTTL